MTEGEINKVILYWDNGWRYGELVKILKKRGIVVIKHPVTGLHRIPIGDTEVADK